MAPEAVLPQPVLSVRNLTKRYDRVTALDGASFDVRQGEVLGLIGPNGSGKTTLFECLGGVMPADGGEILADGRRLDPSARGRLLFYLPDGISPWPSEPIGWILDFTIGFLRGRAADRDRIVDGLGVRPLLDAPLGTLSKGQRQRALLAVALLAPQPVLLIDEPFDGLDLRQSRDVARALGTEAAAGRTIFLSIHQISDAARVCDRFVLLSGGRVRGEGTLDDLSAVAARAGTPAPHDLEEVFLALT